MGGSGGGGGFGSGGGGFGSGGFDFGVGSIGSGTPMNLTSATGTGIGPITRLNERNTAFAGSEAQYSEDKLTQLAGSAGKQDLTIG